MMSILIFALLLCFVAGNVYVEYVNEATWCRWWQETMSHYLDADMHRAWVQWSGFVALALAEVLLIFHAPHGMAWTIALGLAAAGLIGVTATGAVVHSPRWVSRLHIVCSGFAFGAALVAELIALWRTPDVWFPLTAVAIAVLFQRFAPDRTALEEKAFAAAIVAGLVSIAGVPLA